MRDIFWHDETWDLSGEGDFTGVFHLFKGGHDLGGTFKSDVLGVDDYRFPALSGALRWTNEGFDVWDTAAKAFGGDATLTYSLKPFGAAVKPTHRFDVNYSNVDVAAVTDFYELPGVRFGGLASGHNLLEWPSGRFADKRDEGRLTIVPPAGAPTMTASLAAARAADANHARHEWGPFAPMPLPAHVPIAGELTYRFDPTTVYLEDGIFATPDTHVSFSGTTDWGERSQIPFHVTSRDWQESDQILAGIITDFGSPTGVVAFNGRGEFDGVMTGEFRRPRVEGRFTGEDLRAWDTLWGDGSAHLVVDNNYVTIRDSIVRLGGAEIRTEGKFSLGYPRRDGGEEINARFRVARRDLDSLRHAFELEEYPVSGALSGEFHLTGQYEHPIGFGRMTIDDGLAYDESFQKADASLGFDGSGVRLDGITIVNAGGEITGAAYVGWDSTYSFNANGRRIPVGTIAMLEYPNVPMSGLAEFQASGSGTFDVPRYDVRFVVNDMFVAEEGVGHVTGSLALRGTELSGNVDAASPRLALTGAGRISLLPQRNSELTFRFHDSSFDPYVRLFVPKLSPYTTAVATGSIRVAGELSNVDRLQIEGTIDTLDMRLFDYALKNAAPIRLSMERYQVKVGQLQLVGEGTKLGVSGSVGLHDEQIALKVEGDANLGILQGFFRNVRGSGHARLAAAVNGPLREPLFSGSATITGGRVRHLSLPNALDAINGVVYFDPRGVRLDDLTASLGGGQLQFGGRVGFVGYTLGDLNVTVRGENVRLRYPEGVRSQIDGDLALRGSFASPTLGGSVTVRNAVWSRRIDPTAGLFDFGAGAAGPAAPAAADAVPLRFDIRVVVPSSLHVDNNLVENMVASADLQLRGTYDRPVVFGRAEVDRGIVRFEGRRYTITRGTIDFTNPARIEPFFDVEAETMVRVPGQTYRVIVSAAGTADRLQPQLGSDPPLPAGDVVTLLFSDVRRGQSAATGVGDVELRARQNPNERQTDILTTRATQLLATPLSSEVGRVVEQTFGVDTFQLSPSLVDPYSQTTTLRVNPSARVTIGKRISDRIFLTFSRSINADRNDQIILLEYNESDLVSWILSRNEDQTYAIEFRVRHTF
jgi:translocation and assembly module TamB